MSNDDIHLVGFNALEYDVLNDGNIEPYNPISIVDDTCTQNIHLLLWGSRWLLTLFTNPSDISLIAKTILQSYPNMCRNMLKEFFLVLLNKIC